jgi:hypothetical protein
LSDLKTLYHDLTARLPALKQVIATGTPRLSYTQWEAYLAIYHRKPLLIAVPEAEAKGDRSIDANEGAQQAHLERLKAFGHYAEITFANADRLAIAVLRSHVLRPLVQVGLFSQLRPSVAGPLAEVGVSHRLKPVVLPYPSIGMLFKGRDEFMTELRRSPGAGRRRAGCLGHQQRHSWSWWYRQDTGSGRIRLVPS